MGGTAVAMVTDPVLLSYVCPGWQWSGGESGWYQKSDRQAPPPTRERSNP